MNPKMCFVFALGVTIVASASLADSHKAEVCHKGRTIDVASASVAAHQWHGDVACSCEDIDACAVSGGTLDPASCQCTPPEQIVGMLCTCVDPLTLALTDVPFECGPLSYCIDGVYLDCVYACFDLGLQHGASGCDPYCPY
jgi:hypothetical protein